MFGVYEELNQYFDISREFRAGIMGHMRRKDPHFFIGGYECVHEDEINTVVAEYLKSRPYEFASLDSYKLSQISKISQRTILKMQKAGDYMSLMAFGEMLFELSNMDDNYDEHIPFLTLDGCYNNFFDVIDDDDIIVNNYYIFKGYE